MTTKKEKARRMEIRKNTGSRVIMSPQPRMKSGGSLEAHACFHCRVSFKVELRDGLAPCPNCRAPLAPMGRSFKAPKKSNVLQWKKVEKLWMAGIRFPTIWGGVHRPKRWQDADDFIRLVQLHQIEQRRH
ncbi:hypothetical protein [Parasphingorhabdus halotolerans]|uniref:Uncharacterized protein n=1 Tax=Parasphingorhabdus halotolerans TaxID=2725558 RepID=A0A6H2DNN4_9SPHN|nr:hypothetical protein [Parasphingorhabdus halotolerans]QJB69964.1 hypothetical protein HF685_12250 [Parasphingorhabdus halotolerans]